MNRYDDFWDRAGGADVDALSVLENMRPGLRRARQRRRLALASGTAVLLLPVVIGLGVLRGSGGRSGGTEVVTATVPDFGTAGTADTTSTTDPLGDLGTPTTATAPATTPGTDPTSGPDLTGEGDTVEGGTTTSTSAPGSTTAGSGGGPTTSSAGDPSPDGSDPTSTTTLSPTTSPGTTTTRPDPSSSTTSTSTTIPQTTTTTSGDQQQTFTAASGGSVTVSWNSGGMTLVSVNPAPGYTSQVDSQSSTEIKVEFDSATAKTDVVIHFDNGQPTASYSYEADSGDSGDSGGDQGD